LSQRGPRTISDGFGRFQEPPEELRLLMLDIFAARKYDESVIIAIVSFLEKSKNEN
jgi:hypothetical protein